MTFMEWGYKTPLERFYDHLKNPVKGGPPKYPLNIDIIAEKMPRKNKSGPPYTSARQAVVHAAFHAQCVKKVMELERQIERDGRAQAKGEEEAKACLTKVGGFIRSLPGPYIFDGFPGRLATPSDLENALVDYNSNDASEALLKVFMDLARTVKAHGKLRGSIKIRKSAHNASYWDWAFFSMLARFFHSETGNLPTKDGLFKELGEATLTDLGEIEKRNKNCDQVSSRIRAALLKIQENPFWDSPVWRLTIAPYGISSAFAPKNEQGPLVETVIFLKTL